MTCTVFIDGPNLRKQKERIDYKKLLEQLEIVIGTSITDKHIYGYVKTKTIVPFLIMLKSLGYRYNYGRGNYKYKLIRDLNECDSNIVVLVTTDRRLVDSLPRNKRLIIAGYVKPNCPGFECIRIPEGLNDNQ